MEIPKYVLELMVLLETMNISSSIIDDENLLTAESCFLNKKRYLVLIFKNHSPIVENLKHNKYFHNMADDEELITCLDKSKIVRDNVDANGIIPSKHYFGPIVRVNLEWPLI